MRGVQGARLGSIVGACFGLVYVQVNAGSLADQVEWPVRALGVLAFLAVLAAIWRRRDQPEGGTAATGRSAQGPRLGRGYWLTVLVEVVVLLGGIRILAGPLGHPQAGVTWVSLVVGLHFVPLGIIFGEPFFHVLGLAIAACGAAGLVLVLTGASQAPVNLVSGVVPGALLLGCAWWGAHRTARVESKTGIRPGAPAA